MIPSEFTETGAGIPWLLQAVANVACCFDVEVSKRMTFEIRCRAPGRCYNKLEKCEPGDGAMQLTDSSFLRTQAFIDGKWIDADGGEIFAVTNPATDETIAKVAR
jgi:hypothetical protein